MEKTEIKKFITKIESHLPCILVSVNTTTKGDSLAFRFNRIKVENEAIIFGLRNTFDHVRINIKDIVDMAEAEYDSIKLTLNNGEEFGVCLGEDYYPERPQHEEIELDDFLSRLKQSMVVTVRFGEQGTLFTRAAYSKCFIEDSENDDDHDGDRYVKVTFGNDDVFTQIELDEYETKIKVAKHSDENDVVYLELPNMPYTTLMLVLCYQTVTMSIPVNCLM